MNDLHLSVLDCKATKYLPHREKNLHYFTDERFQKGIKTIQIENNQFRIYDLEKTVIDIVFYREKIGIEEMKEVLTNYLKRENRNLDKLLKYADILKCGKTIRQYLEVLV